MLSLFPTQPRDLDQLRRIAFGASVDQGVALNAQVKQAEEQLVKYEQQPSTPMELRHGHRSEDIARTIEKLEHCAGTRKLTWDQLGDPPAAADKLIIRSKQREKTLVGERTKMVVGFLDLQVVADIPAALTVKTKSYPAGYQSGIPTRPAWYWSREPRCLNFEIKTAIPNLGELLRQINVRLNHS